MQLSPLFGMVDSVAVFCPNCFQLQCANEALVLLVYSTPQGYDLVAAHGRQTSHECHLGNLTASQHSLELFHWGVL